MTDPGFVTLHEMGPRDGLQNERTPVSTSDKVQLINLLSAAGFREIEATAFVSPKWVPQMADAGAVMAGIIRAPGVRYSVLTPNMKGYEAARDARADAVAVFASASETFSQKNINCSIAESFERFRPILAAAKADGIPVRGYVSTVVVCPYEGPIAPQAVARVTEGLLAEGVEQVSLGDTVGRGTPESIGAMLDAVLAVADADRLAAHYHDTNGRAAETLRLSLERGLRHVDSAVTGLGGCPYAPGARGNVATETVLDVVEELGLSHGIDRDSLSLAATHIRRLITPAATTVS